MIDKIIKDLKRVIYVQDKAKFFKQNIPYLAFFYLGDIFFHHVRSYIGGDIIDKILAGILDIQTISFLPSIHPMDLLVGIGLGVGVKLIVYNKGKNAKKFRKGREYGSARWGGIEEVSSSSFTFVPHIGDEVEVFKTETRIIVSKVEKKPDPLAGGININLSQNQNASAHASANIYGTGNLKPVNKIVYILLAFFLGSLGAHKFYAGRIVAGIIYLLLCFTFIPGFLGILAAISALFKRPDAQGNIWV